MPTEPNPLAPGLYLVATPIGNLRDITLRALDVLAGADLVLAEDTRVGGKLLAAHGLSARLDRYDEHAAGRARPKILAALAEGARIALISDAGTPLVSDPGYRLVSEALAQGSPVYPIPGASAVMAALTIAGLPTDRFLFAGFPPTGRPVAARCSPNSPRFGRPCCSSKADRGCLAASRIWPPRSAHVRHAVAREIDRLHETVIRGSLEALAGDPRLLSPKGEMVIVVGPGEEGPATRAEAGRRTFRSSPAPARPMPPPRSRGLWVCHARNSTRALALRAR